MDIPRSVPLPGSPADSRVIYAGAVGQHPQKNSQVQPADCLHARGDKQRLPGSKQKQGRNGIGIQQYNRNGLLEARNNIVRQERFASRNNVQYALEEERL